MSNSNKKKADQLGMPIGTAANRLRKQFMFRLLRETGKDTCFQCSKQIESVRDLSIEHIVPWLDSSDPVETYFDLDNIAFSHLKCNSGAARRQYSSHGTQNRYQHHGCRCAECTKANTLAKRKFRAEVVEQQTRRF